MDDEAIVELYFARAEEAIAETSKKYGAYLYQMAWNLLKNSCDAEEAVSDTYLDAWNTIPPTRPRILRHFLSRITRNAALDRLDYRKAKKRGGDSPLEELDECVPDSRTNPEKILEARELGLLLNRFLATLQREDAAIFVGRCYYGLSISDLSDRWGITDRQVKYRLSCTRGKLRSFIEREGVNL